MGDIVDRYDRRAEDYLRWWAPLLAPASRRLIEELERLDPGLTGREPRSVVETGCGTGSFLGQAVRRWPAARLVGVDASSGMLAVARRELAMLAPVAGGRIRFVQADAAALPLADGSADVVASAFVVQLVPDRAAVLAEFRRVLRPGGMVALAGWLAERAGEPFAPDEALEAALAEVGVTRPPNQDLRAGDFESPDAAARELREAGFGEPAADGERLDFSWTPATYVGYRLEYRDRDLFDGLDGATRSSLLRAFRGRLEALPPEAFRFRPPVVVALARRD